MTLLPLPDGNLREMFEITKTFCSDLIKGQRWLMKCFPECCTLQFVPESFMNIIQWRISALLFSPSSENAVWKSSSSLDFISIWNFCHRLLNRCCLKALEMLVEHKMSHASTFFHTIKVTACQASKCYFLWRAKCKPYSTKIDKIKSRWWLMWNFHYFPPEISIRNRAKQSVNTQALNLKSIYYKINK